MTAHIPPMAHDETDFFDAVERELVALTTAELVEKTSLQKARLQPAFPHTTKLKTVIPAQAGTHSMREFNTDANLTTAPRCYGSPPSRGRD